MILTLLFLLRFLFLVNCQLDINCSSSSLSKLADCAALMANDQSAHPTSLDISYNPGLKMDDADDGDQWMHFTTKLLRLTADACDARALPSSLLTNAVRLEWFSSRGNSITRLPYAPFTSNPALVYLCLADNLLRYLGDSSFRGLSVLRYLDVSGNRISVIDRWALLPLVSLNTLLLNG